MAEAIDEQQREDVQDRQQGFQSNALYAIAQFLSRQAPDDPLMQDARRFLHALNPAAFFPDPAPGPQPVPTPSRVVLAMDVSSNNGRDIAGLIDRYGPDAVICKAYQSVELGGRGAAYTVNQASVARAKGKAAAAYIWLYAGLDGARQAASGLDTIRQAGIAAPVVWLDCESYTDGSDPGPEVIRAAVAEVERQGLKAGIYTGRWWLQGHYPGGEVAFSAEFGRLPAWLSQYDGIRALESTRMPDGWPAENLAGKQFQGNPIDLSIFKADVLGLS